MGLLSDPCKFNTVIKAYVFPTRGFYFLGKSCVSTGGRQVNVNPQWASATSNAKWWVIQPQEVAGQSLLSDWGNGGCAVQGGLDAGVLRSDMWQVCRCTASLHRPAPPRTELHLRPTSHLGQGMPACPVPCHHIPVSQPILRPLLHNAFPIWPLRSSLNRNDIERAFPLCY